VTLVEAGTPSTDEGHLDRRLLGIAPSTYRPPRPDPANLPREHLVKGLLESADRPIVVVSAPAGYGKSTTMLLWGQADPRPFVWAHLGPADNDARHLLSHLALGLQEIAPLEARVSRAITGPGRSLDEERLPALLSALVDREPFVLVLDDVHHLESAPALRCLTSLMAGLPTGAQLVLVGRSVPSIPVARRRLRSEAWEMGSVELAMSEGETVELFDQQGLALDADEVSTLVRQTEGWPAGLHLAALALARRDHDERRRGFSGRDRLAGDYLVEEVLEGLPPSTVDFLLRSAVLDRMCAPLLDELLETDDARRLLDDIERSGNLFLLPLDNEREWYRYHHLFGEVLRSRLQAEHPAEFRRLQRRASELVERYGDPEGAVRHAMAAGDLERASEVVLRHTPLLVFTGQVARLERWLDLLGGDSMSRSVASALGHAWLGVSRGDAELVHLATLLAERSNWQGPVADGSPSLRAATAIIRAMLGEQGIEGVLLDAETVRECGGPTDNAWWGLATALQGTAYSMLGDDDRARSLLVAAAPAIGGLPAIEAAAQAHLAAISLRHGDLSDADARATRALQAADRYNLQGLVPTVLVFAVGAAVAARRGRQDEARRHSLTTRTLLTRLGDLSPRTRLMALLLLAQAALAVDDRSQARALARDAARTRLRDSSATFLNEQLDELEARLAQQGEGLLPGMPALTAAELRVLAYLPTHLSLKEIADQLLVSRNTAKTHSVAIYRKLGVSSRSDAVREARRIGLVET
jgi:LuxR family transcriptional regulator, maltose regulon positive regulatory protein